MGLIKAAMGAAGGAMADQMSLTWTKLPKTLIVGLMRPTAIWPRFRI